MIFTTFKTHRSRESTITGNNNIAWSLLDPENSQILIKYIFDDGRKDIFSVPLKEIHKWIKMYSNDTFKYEIFTNQPSNKYQYRNYRIFKQSLDTNK